MNAYIWVRTEPVTDNYHPEGGLLITAPTLERARELWEQHPHESIFGKLMTDFPTTATDPEPDRVLPLADTAEETVIIFPDAGCC